MVYNERLGEFTELGSNPLQTNSHNKMNEKKQIEAPQLLQEMGPLQQETSKEKKKNMNLPCTETPANRKKTYAALELQKTWQEVSHHQQGLQNLLL